MNKQILLFTMNPKRYGYEVERVLEEAQKMGVMARHVAYRYMTFDLSTEVQRVFVQGQEINGESRWY